MRTGRPKIALILTEDERQRLASLAHRSRSAPQLARRARIILACADGTDSKVVVRRLHVTPTTVCKWRGRFGIARFAQRTADAPGRAPYFTNHCDGTLAGLSMPRLHARREFW